MAIQCRRRPYDIGLWTVSALAKHDGRINDVEREFLYHVEVLGFTVARAADAVGLRSPAAALQRPEIIEAREALRRAVQQRTTITKEDVVAGYMDAIHIARLIADPKAMIGGWGAIATTLGLNAPTKVDVNVNVSNDELRNMKDSELVKLLEADNVIDADFYEVRQ